MILRVLLLFALFCLAACNKEKEVSQTSTGTFDQPTPPVVESAKVTPPAGPVVKLVTTPAVTPVVAPTIVVLTAEQTARAKAGELKAAGKLQEAALVLRNAGLDEEAYALYAPADYKFEAKDHPAPSSPEVSETPSVMRHSMVLNGKTVWFTAKAGHTIAYGQKDPITGTKDAKAAIFYMSYTRDDLPHENRPVTFFFNGGPGYASIFLHMAAFAPKRIVVNGPYMAPKLADNPFPLIDNEETLLDSSDLVFVDPVATGLSVPIAPHSNADFSTPQTDAEIVRDFVTSYSNMNNRQSSPKYLYGESWGGARVSLAAWLLEDAGTSNYERDPSGKPAKVLSGVMLGSPISQGNGAIAKSTCRHMQWRQNIFKTRKRAGRVVALSTNMPLI
jgi:carboxypeptidase C (cathepsin A)